MSDIACSWLICSNRHDGRFDAAIASCLTHNVPDSEVVVVCNGPQCEDIADKVRCRFDGTPGMIVLATPIRQLVFSLNLGLHHARGRYVSRMDADDLAYPARLPAQFAYMEANPDVVVCGTEYDLIDEHDHVIARVAMPYDDARIRSRLTWTNPFCHPTTMLRRSAVVAVGGYLGGLHAEDYDLWVRLSLVRGVRFANLPLAGIGYRAVAQGEARRARAAYASVASTQFRCFASGFGWRWGAAAAWTALKGVLRGTPVLA